MNITDTIDTLAAEVHAGGNIDELVDVYVNTAQFEIHVMILDEIGDRDLDDGSGPLDLTQGWTNIRAQLAYRALYSAVASAARELNESTSVRRVMDYESDDVLEGAASDELIKASDEASPTGAVAAYRDDEGTWQYVAPSQMDFYRKQRCETVITVYVEAS